MGDIVVMGRRSSANISAGTFTVRTGHTWSERMPAEDNPGNWTVWSSEDQAKRATIGEAVDMMKSDPRYPDTEMAYVIERSPDGSYTIVGPYTIGSPVDTGPYPVPSEAVAYVHNHPLPANPDAFYPGTTVTGRQRANAPSAQDWEAFDSVMATRSSGNTLNTIILGPDGAARVYGATSSRDFAYVSTTSSRHGTRSWRVPS
jgi:hypothetical protein